MRTLRDDDMSYDVQEVLLELEREMLEAADALEFERAAMLRDQARELKVGLGGEMPESGKSRKGKTS